MFEPFSAPAPAKINLALHVLGRRLDGYHELDSIVAFAGVGDTLHFSPAAVFALSADGPHAGSLPPPSDNIVSKAHDLAASIAARRGLRIPGVAIRLSKNLPVASGIGGGSANAAAALRGLLKTAGIGELDSDIMAAALTLGADVPVCLVGRTCRMQGIGERITPLTSFAPRRAVLVNPNLAVATVDVFRKLGLAPGQSHGAAIEDVADPSGWRNDLTESAIAVAPVIAEVLAMFKEHPGVSLARMSGSGATCFALLSGEASDLAATVRSRGWWMAETELAVS